MAYLYETHLHTSEASKCGAKSAVEMVRGYKARGYQGVVVTDHFFNGNTCVPASLPWKDRIEMYCSGYENAKAEGDKIGLQVFFGLEYGVNGSDMLTFGVDKDWLLAHPDVHKWPFSRYSAAVHEAGGFISHAHPFREAPYLPFDHRAALFPEGIDAIETLNYSHRDPLYNLRAEQYRRQLGLPATAGSDAHRVDGARLCAMRFEKPVANIHALIDAIRNQPFDPVLVQGFSR